MADARRLGWALSAALALGAAAPAGVAAQAEGDVETTTEQRDTARALAMYEEAARLYQRGEFGASAELLRQAYRLYDHPTLLYNLARAIEGLGDLSATVQTYERYLQAAPDAPDREMVAARVETLRALMAEREGLLRERARAIRDRERLAARVEPDEPLSHGPWPWVVTGVGLAGVGAGAALWLLALDARDSAEVEPEQREAFRLHSRAESLAVGATASMIAGGALALVGFGWWLYGQLFQPYVEGFRDLTLSVGPTGLGAEVRF